ncbi:MAG: hypothetical protein K2M86_04015, partial [Odoribacter sp.]|nr:hypothetical protein [Odoribacter sp.]
ESTFEVLREVAIERGMKVEDIYTSEQIDREFWEEEFGAVFREEQPEDSDILRICQIYEYWAERCLEKVMKLSGHERLGEDLEVVSWYLDLMQAKMRRALNGYALRREPGRRKVSEYNGLAKVALISIELSEASWKNIRKYFAECAAEIGHLLVMLEQLRVDIERLFPNAREFQRPGFEKPVD